MSYGGDALIENEGLEEMTEGQLADYMARIAEEEPFDCDEGDE